jgi:hypothetical protein
MYELDLAISTVVKELRSKMFGATEPMVPSGSVEVITSKVLWSAL